MHPESAFKVAALIAAAGNSSRMGTPKALLPFMGSTFFDVMADALKGGGVDRIFATLPDEILYNGALSTCLPFPIRFCVNAYPHRQLLGSVQSVLSHPDFDAEALLVCPIDMPFITSKLIDQFLAQPLQDPVLLIAAHKGQTGHPLLVTHHFFDEVLALGNEDSMRVILQRHSAQITHIESSDLRVLVNINTQEDYARLTKPSDRIFDAAATEAPGVKLV